MKLQIANLFFILALSISACSKSQSLREVEKREVPEEFKKYWNNGEAEISSFQLSQARYGELREGKAVMVFVTEPFSRTKLVKYDTSTQKEVPVLKLNFIKNFVTGIYDYSMITSSFLPIYKNEHTMKISSSIHEWCGQAYMQLENRDDFEIQIHSYFESVVKQKIQIKKNNVEDEIWSLIRINPEKLPLGNIKMLPSFFYLRLMHQNIEYQDAVATIENLPKNITSYNLNYKALQRNVKIYFENTFPYRIVKFEESYPDGFATKKMLTTTGILIKTIQNDYWNKNTVANEGLREELGL